MTNKEELRTKKVGWFCTYTPEEIIYAAGFTPYRLLPLNTGTATPVEDALPPNICPYPRKILGNLRSNAYSDLSGLVIANSCNAMMHLYNVLKDEADIFVHLLDAPRRQDQAAVDFFTRELELLANHLGEHGREPSEKRLKKAVEVYRRKNKLLQTLIDLNGPVLKENYPLGFYGLAGEAASTCPVSFNQKLAAIIKENGLIDNPDGPEKTALLLAGGLPPKGLVEMLAENENFILYPENCTGMRYLQKPQPESTSSGPSTRKAILEALSRSYLEKLPCPRAFNRDARENYYRQLLDSFNVRGIIYHDLLFCDMCHYDYLMLLDLIAEKGVPHLQIKSELGEEDLGQLKTRVEAFLEILA